MEDQFDFYIAFTTDGSEIQHIEFRATVADANRLGKLLEDLGAETSHDVQLVPCNPHEFPGWPTV